MSQTIFSISKETYKYKYDQKMKDCGHGVVRSVSKNSTSQFNIPSEENYNQLIEKYEINKMLCFIIVRILISTLQTSYDMCTVEIRILRLTPVKRKSIVRCSS